MSWISKLILCLSLCKVKCKMHSECCNKCTICDSDCMKSDSSQMASRINSIRRNEELFSQASKDTLV